MKITVSNLAIFVMLIKFQTSICKLYDVYLINDVQSSVNSEKFPLLRFLTNLKLDDYWNGTRITNLKNLGNVTYRNLFKTSSTVFFVYGWLDSTSIEFKNDSDVQIEDYSETLPFQWMYSCYYYGFTKNSPNFVGLNWTAYNQNDFLTVINSLQLIANEIGDQLYEMAVDKNDPVDLSNWHFVGFSLGAHIVGLIARRIKERSFGELMISRVTGLDPAGPLLTYPITSLFFPHLEKYDGELLLIIFFFFFTKPYTY